MTSGGFSYRKAMMIVNHGKRETPAGGELALQSMVRFLEPVPRNIIMTGEPMADETKKETVTLEELTVSNLAMTDAAVKLLIEKGVFTDEECLKNHLSLHSTNSVEAFLTLSFKWIRQRVFYVHKTSFG